MEHFFWKFVYEYFSVPYLIRRNETLTLKGYFVVQIEVFSSRLWCKELHIAKYFIYDELFKDEYWNILQVPIQDIDCGCLYHGKHNSYLRTYINKWVIGYLKFNFRSYFYWLWIYHSSTFTFWLYSSKSRLWQMQRLSKAVNFTNPFLRRGSKVPNA